MLPEIVPIGLFAVGAGVAAILLSPLIVGMWARTAGGIEQYQQVKVEQAVKELDDLFMLDVKPGWLKVAYGVGPVVASLLIFLVTSKAWLIPLGAAVGLIVPDLWVKYTRSLRRRRFHSQLVDALFILSSSLRAGLSMAQAFEQLESEMAPPASQEFGLMMKAHRLGLTLEESLQRLNQRMPSDELNLVTTAVLVARETGGDITEIIKQLILTIRERKKLGDKVQTLTMQGRLQAYLMSGLPVIFAVFINSIIPHYFDVFLGDATGQMWLIGAIVLWLLGMVLLIRFSKVEI